MEHNHISVDKFEMVVNESYSNIVKVDFMDMEVEIRKLLPLDEVMELVREVSDLCFLEDGDFIPEIQSFALKSAILTHYTNFELPENLNRQYDLIYRSGAAEFVMDYINQIQLDEIIGAIDTKVDFISREKIESAQAELRELSEYLGSIGDEMEKMMSGINSKDMEKMMKAFDSSSFDEEKLVRAYMDAVRTDVKH